MAATPTYKEGAYWTRVERTELGGSDQKFFDHHAFYVDCNVTNVFYSGHKGSKGDLGAYPQKNFHNYIPYKAGECPFANITRKLQSIIFDIEKTTTKYQMIKVQSYGRARAGKIVELGGTASHAIPWLRGWTHEHRLINGRLRFLFKNSCKLQVACISLRAKFDDKGLHHIKLW